jgi:putative oligomerization/nucleic acid binding protein
MIISIPFKILGILFGSSEEEKVVEKQIIIEKNNSSNAEQLSKLSELLEKDLISEEEFQAEKTKILNP